MGETNDYVDAAAGAWSRVFPDRDLLAYAVVIRLIRAGSIAESSLDQVTARHGFGVRGDYDVLATLRRAHPASLRPQDIADRVMVSAPGITGRLDRLEKAGLITRRPHPSDRRATLIELTAQGIELADSTFQSILEAADRLLEGVPRSEQEDLAAGLRALMLVLGDLPRSL